MGNELGVDVNRRKTVAEEIGEEYKDWNKRGIILLNIAMGRGKTHFIIEILGKHARENNEKILYLVNRSALKKENEQRAHEMGIQIESYQAIQQKILDAYYDGKEYEVEADYIVCDECHYFILDAWNGKTDVIYDWIMKRGEVLRIFMSATTGYNKNLFKVFRNDYAKYHRFRKEYTVEADYSYIERIVFYESEDYVAKLIKELPENEKLIYFGKKIKKVNKIYTGCGDKASFICSESKSKYKKYIDKDAIDEQFRMTKQVICTTSVLDNGINIKDEQLKHVVVEFDDMIQLVQSLGRKRVWKFEDGQVVLPPEERITFYVKNWSKGELQNFKKSKESDIREVELNKDENKDEKNEYFKSENKKRRMLKELNNPCYYLEHIEGRMELKLNRMVEQKLKTEVESLNIALKIGFHKQVLDTLGKTFVGKIEYETKVDTKRAERNEYLKEIVGKQFIGRENIKVLVTKLQYKDKKGKQYTGFSSINRLMKEEESQYSIEKKRLGGGGKTYWIVVNKGETQE